MYMGPIEAAPTTETTTRPLSIHIATGLVVAIVLVPWLIVRVIGHFIVRDIRLVGRALSVLGEEIGAARR
jgi:hypothetical protein